MTTKAPRLIAFCGVKQSGKDTAGKVFVSNGHIPISFAEPMKDMVRALLRYRGVRWNEIERMMEGDLKEIPTPAFGGKTPRVAMQTLGSEWGRELLADSLWTESLGSRMKLLGQNNYVLTDCRLQSEAKYLRENGFTLVRVLRPGLPQSADSHQTEAEINALPVDDEIVNDHPSARVFVEAVSRKYFGVSKPVLVMSNGLPVPQGA
jgi:hypothetical protein